MNNKSLSKYIAIILFITMVTLIVIASTYARYTSNFGGAASANTSDWLITVNDGASVFTINSELNSKIYPGASNVHLGNIVVKNDSEKATASISSITATLDDEELKDTITLSAPSTSDRIEHGSEVEIPVYANWSYNPDADETQYADRDLSFSVSLTVDQITQ